MALHFSGQVKTKSTLYSLSKNACVSTLIVSVCVWVCMCVSVCVYLSDLAHAGVLLGLCAGPEQAWWSGWRGQLEDAAEVGGVNRRLRGLQHRWLSLFPFGRKVQLLCCPENKKTPCNSLQAKSQAVCRKSLPCTATNQPKVPAHHREGCFQKAFKYCLSFKWRW